MLYQPTNEATGGDAGLSMYSDDMLFEMMAAQEEIIARRGKNGATGQEPPKRTRPDQASGE